ncbi:SIR2 family protein [Hansschlegelia sp. KR7-227]|uniref:SIR2 family protein n=1 Tax=Hansschlegelia sp. KR7-227 TaxID=3400914 RepID=UPI003C031C54
MAADRTSPGRVAGRVGTIHGAIRSAAMIPAADPCGHRPNRTCYVRIINYRRRMAQSDSVALLCSLLQPSNDARPTLLLGAGASFSSGVPLAAESVKRLAKTAYADRVLGGKTLPEQIKVSEWLTWLQEQPWFMRGDDRLAENFPLVVEHLLRPAAYRRRVLLELVSPSQKIGDGYRALAEMTLRGLTGIVLTTNFDICLPKALNDKKPHIKHVAEVNRAPNDLAEFSLYARALIVWLHGKAEQYSDRNLVSETQTLDPKLVQTLVPLLDSTPLIVAGYRGAEPSIMTSLLGPSADIAFRHGVYWSLRKGETPHANVEALRTRLGPNFQYLEIDSFDALFSELNRELAGVQRFAPADVAAPKQFDDQIVAGATWADVDADLALKTLRVYCGTLGRGVIDAKDLKPLMRELGLLATDGASERPSVGCILLFGRDTGRFFPHAVISATIDGKKRRVFGGNLVSQHASVLEWFEQEKVNPSLKVKGRRRHQQRNAFPERALVELLVNMIVHRDYEIEKISTIDATPSDAVRFANPGAALPDATRRLALDQDGAFEPVAQFSDLRNRSLCDIFFGMNAMERAGTGLTDAVELAVEQGGSAAFAYPPGQDSFVARLFQPGSSAGSATVARDTRPVGSYVINLLPFASTPRSLTHVLLTVQNWSQFALAVDLDNVGTFVFEARSGDLWTFASTEEADQMFGRVAAAPARAIALADVEADRVLQSKFSWLIRRHFERYLQVFEGKGLVIEKDKRGRPARRAYFTALRGDNRTLIYDTPNRRNVRRDVVKRRGDGQATHFECEGFGYEVVRQANVWGVRIKPFYMFAKRDGASPLPGYLRTRKSVRRIKFDRNANVESDLTFWARFLSDGRETINIGQTHVDDLLLEGGFVTEDVQEEGLLNGFAAQDKRSA